jgi:DNA-binding protein H-NS
MPRDGMQTLFLKISEFALETMKKYIHKLEEENGFRKQEISELKLEVVALRK